MLTAAALSFHLLAHHSDQVPCHFHFLLLGLPATGTAGGHSAEAPASPDIQPRVPASAMCACHAERVAGGWAEHSGGWVWFWFQGFLFHPGKHLNPRLSFRLISYLSLLFWFLIQQDERS